jgi:hypothetical protein
MPTRIEQLASNSTMYYRGDECMEIAPFDNYYMFTIYKESNDGEPDNSVPLNLTNLGSLFLSFANGDETVRIENYRDAENIDMANGEVVFRIGKDDAKKIIGFSSNTFYISSQITDGKTASDETVLYSGEWVEFSKGMKTSLTITIATLKNTVAELQSKLQDTVDEYEVKLEAASTEIESLKGEITSKNATITELQNIIDTYNSDIVDYIEANILETRTADGNGGASVPNEKLPSTESEQGKTTRQMERDAENLRVSWLSNFKKANLDNMTASVQTGGNGPLTNKGKGKR